MCKPSLMRRVLVASAIGLTLISAQAQNYPSKAISPVSYTHLTLPTKRIV